MCLALLLVFGLHQGINVFLPPRTLHLSNRLHKNFSRLCCPKAYDLGAQKAASTECRISNSTNSKGVLYLCEH